MRLCVITGRPADDSDIRFWLGRWTDVERPLHPYVVTSVENYPQLIFYQTKSRKTGTILRTHGDNPPPDQFYSFTWPEDSRLSHFVIFFSSPQTKSRYGGAHGSFLI
jgi:hypothetical protein